MSRSIQPDSVSVEVSNGSASFRVSVQAQTIERALEIAQRQNPGKECNVAFPIDAETFFAKDNGVARVGALGMVGA
jgi:hypothetical protein